MVELRIDARLQGRIDASDVLQDGFLDLSKRVESYLSDPRLPAFLWLRLVVSDRLAMVHRLSSNLPGGDQHGRAIELF